MGKKIFTNDILDKGLISKGHTHFNKKETIQLKMGRGPELTFSQRRYTDGQQAHEKMFNIFGYQRNANQNYNEILPHTGQNVNHQNAYKQ